MVGNNSIGGAVTWSVVFVSVVVDGRSTAACRTRQQIWQSLIGPAHFVTPNGVRRFFLLALCDCQRSPWDVRHYVASSIHQTNVRRLHQRVYENNFIQAFVPTASVVVARSRFL